MTDTMSKAESWGHAAFELALLPLTQMHVEALEARNETMSPDLACCYAARAATFERIIRGIRELKAWHLEDGASYHGNPDKFSRNELKVLGVSQPSIALLVEAQTALEMAEEFTVEPLSPYMGTITFVDHQRLGQERTPTKADQLRAEADKLDRQSAAAKMVREVRGRLRKHLGMKAD